MNEINNNVSNGRTNKKIIIEHIRVGLHCFLPEEIMFLQKPHFDWKLLCTEWRRY